MLKVLDSYFDGKLRTFIVGQSLSSGTASTGLGSGVADLHAETKGNLIKADAINLQETLTDQLVQPLVSYNRQQYPEWPDCKLKFVIDNEETNVKELLDGAKALHEMGVGVDAENLREVAGLQPPQDRAVDQSTTLPDKISGLIGKVVNNPQPAAQPAAPQFSRRGRRQRLDWDESLHPRADDGKFGEGGGDSSAGESSAGESESAPKTTPAHESLKKSFSKTLGPVMQAKPELGQKYEADIHHVIDHMSPEAVNRVQANIAGVKWHATVEGVTGSVGKLMAERGQDFDADKHHVAGCYDSKAKNLLVDGGYGEGDSKDKANSGRQVYAHELSHAFDCPAGGDPKKDRISSTPEWHQAYHDEILGGKLSKYAKTKPVEGFAEFGRLAILEPARAKQEFPKCWGVWQKHKLV
jgi:hypothetical protein